MQSIGIPVTVIIDDYIPVSENFPVFTKASLNNELWPILLEKAFAKLNGNYYLLKSGISINKIFEALLTNQSNGP